MAWHMCSPNCSPTCTSNHCPMPLLLHNRSAAHLHPISHKSIYSLLLSMFILAVCSLPVANPLLQLATSLSLLHLIFTHSSVCTTTTSILILLAHCNAYLHFSAVAFPQFSRTMEHQSSATKTRSKHQRHSTSS